LLLLCGVVAGRAAERVTPVVLAVQKALPSVVNIGTEMMVNVLYDDPVRSARDRMVDQLLGDAEGVRSSPGSRVEHSLGSGVIVSEDGYILTNFHVVERSSRIRVTLSDEATYDAVLVAGDEISDLALIKIDPIEPLVAIDIVEDSVEPLLGETVIALGNPFGLEHSVSVGVLSARDREATYQGQVLFRDILQTDAAINPGSSGGPLLNINGRLMGVSVAVSQDGQSIGFAVPAKRVQALLAKWLDPEYIEGLWLGMDVVASNREVAVMSGDVESPALASGFAAGAALARRRLGVELSGDVASVDGYSGRGIPVGEIRPDGPLAELDSDAKKYWLIRIGEYEMRVPSDVTRALSGVSSGELVVVSVARIHRQGSLIVAEHSQIQIVTE